MTSSPGARTVELFFVDGRPDGMLTAEIFNWTGHVLMAPRTQIQNALDRPQASYTGVYLLLGEKDGELTAYIGEAQDVAIRVRTHDARLDWWNRAIIITSVNDRLTGPHAQYLRSRLVATTRASGRVKLDHATTPVPPKLSEAAQANMEAFLDQLMFVLQALRIDPFVESILEETELPQPELPVFELKRQKPKLYATGRPVGVGKQFVVFAGSQARKNWKGKPLHNRSYRQLYRELIQRGLLQERDEHRVFVSDYTFDSYSAAAAIVVGNSASGPREWRLKSKGTTLGQWLAEHGARSAGVWL
jgi:hypothetical protein